MRTPKVLLDFVRWRWAPTVALSTGAVFYVALAVVLIPEHIGQSVDGAPGPVRAASFAARIGATAAVQPEEAPAPIADVTPAKPSLELTPTPAGDSPARRGFSPPLPRADPPPPVEMPAAPAPTSTPTFDVMAPPNIPPTPPLPPPVATTPPLPNVPPDIASLPQSDPNQPPTNVTPEIPPPAPPAQ